MCVRPGLTVGDQMTTLAKGHPKQKRRAVEARRPLAVHSRRRRVVCVSSLCRAEWPQVAHFSARCELSDHWVRTRESGVQLQGDRDIPLPSGLTQWRTQPDGQDGQSFKRRPEAQLLPPQVASAYCRVFEKPDWIAGCSTRRFPRTTPKGKRHLRTKRTRHQPRRGRHCPQSSDPEPTSRRPTSRQLALH